uniref:Peptidase metallopeptidase domain-containing protein n=1 Tax=Pelusios castaneus TaxID=367368 RepID=A0A8C8SA27_9SAUR
MLRFAESWELVRTPLQTGTTQDSCGRRAETGEAPWPAASPVSAQVVSLLLLPLLLALPTAARPAPTPADESEEVDWLMQYGYLPTADPVTGQLQTWEAVTSAIRVMQRFAGIPETGIPDDATLELIRTPRCSLPDVLSTLPEKLPKRKNGRWWQMRRKSRGRRSAGLAWTKRNISWKLKTYPQEARLSREIIRTLMYYALKVWSEATPLTFHEVGGPRADVVVEFLRRDHQDGYPFDGRGGMVAHAFFPEDPQRAGRVHFDTDEDWTFRSPDDYGMDLFAVAVHEFGHSLGLAHSPSKRSIMRPYYQGPVGDPLQYQLQAEDRADVQKLYGTAFETVSKLDLGFCAQPDLVNRSEKEFPDHCSSSIDAVAQIRGETFLFKGRYFWRLSHSRHLASLRPALSAAFWRGLPRSLSKVDAVYERPTDHRILFFSGPLYWLFKDNGVEEGYPRTITDFGLPQGGVDAAFSRPQDRKTYFFKGNLQWCYDEVAGHMDQGFPAHTLLLGQLPTPVDAMLREVYVFKGRHYWKLDQHSLKLEKGYPRSIARDWLDCTGELHPPLSVPTSLPPGANPGAGQVLPTPSLRSGRLEPQEWTCEPLYSQE